MNERVRQVVGKVVALLVAEKYLEVEALTLGIRLTADDMARAVREYGRHLVSLPEHAFDSLDAVEVVGPKEQWAVVMPLWTKEEGRSDLSIVLTILVEGEQVSVQLDDLHVL